jgi:glutathione S-transferase
MTAGTLNILKPSVNNLTVRIFVRAAGLDVEERDVSAWAEEYMTAMEATLGEAYSQPAADVRDHIAQMKSSNA